MIRQSFKTFFSLFVLLLTGVLSLSAQQVTEKAALSKAKKFFDQSDVVSRRASRKTPQLTLANNRNEFYVFNDEANGGYVVVAGDDRMPDVLGYSYTGHFDAADLPCNMKAWLEEYAKQVEYLRTHPEVTASRRTTTEREGISPLLKCQYNQGSSQGGIENRKCPIINGNQCLTGCVATAMAQIMYYYQWPKQTTETIPGYTTYIWEIDMPAIPVTTIDWDNIFDKYFWDVNYSEEQLDAISTLMLLCGTSIETEYTDENSGAFSNDVAKAFRKYFNYDDKIEFVDRYKFKGEIKIWEQMIYEELKDRRPVLYSGGSHSFVLDGYRDGYYHVNFGWGGSYDDYYLLTDLKGYQSRQDATIGIKPASPDSPRRYGVFDNGKMTMYYDKEMSHRAGTVLPEDWENYADQITECVIDPSFANLEMRSLWAFFAGWNNCKSITGLENLKTSKTIDMSAMFNGCSSLTSLDVSHFNTDNVIDMGSMFSDCSSLTSLDVSKFNTENVANMREMFYFCRNLTTIDVSGFNTDNVTNMKYMFYDCEHLTSLDVSGFKTDNVTDMSYMFYYCFRLTSLDVSGFKTDKVENMSNMFSNCLGLTTIYASKRWNMSNVLTAENMFKRCTNLIGGAGTPYDENYINGDYAHIDEGISNPGYFTYKTPPIIPGDVNGDGLVNVTDIVATVNYIMEKPSDIFNKDAADLNGDGEVNVTDIVIMVSIIMSGDN
jgi:surface protein